MYLKRTQLNKKIVYNSFTLIELIIVIAIIAILMSIMLPALRKARDKSIQIVCGSQMKQLWLGYNSYSDDHNDWLLAWRVKYGTSSLYWPYYLQDYLKLPRQSGNLPRTILRCPAENLTLSAASSALWTPSSYAVNGSTWQAGHLPRYRRYQLKQPSVYSIFVDSNGQNVYWGKDNFASPVYMAYRHNKGLNVLFLDGHVKHYLYNSLPPLGSDCFWDGTTP